MSYPNRVRLANSGDEEELMELCRGLAAENAMFPVSDDKVRAMLRRAFNKEGGFLGVIGLPGKIEGMIYMNLSTFWYSDVTYLEELFLYVAPQYRKSRNAIDLMRFSKWCSDQSSFTLVIGVISNKETEGKVRLYQRQFAKPAGNFFYYKGQNNTVAATG